MGEEDEDDDDDDDDDEGGAKAAAPTTETPPGSSAVVAAAFCFVYSFVVGCCFSSVLTLSKRKREREKARGMPRALLRTQRLGTKKKIKNSPRSSERVRPGVRRTTPTTLMMPDSLPPPLVASSLPSLKGTPISHAASGGEEASVPSRLDAALASSRRAARTQGWALRPMVDERGGIRSSPRSESVQSNDDDDVKTTFFFFFPLSISNSHFDPRLLSQRFHRAFNAKSPQYPSLSSQHQPEPESL